MSTRSPANRSTGNYLDELMKELQTITSIYETNNCVEFRNSQNLLLREIQQVWESEMMASGHTSQITSDTSTSGIELSTIGRLLRDDSPPTRRKLSVEENHQQNIGDTQGNVEKSDKLFFPPESPTNSNPVGRLIGPRGLTIRQFEKDLNCKLFIRGKGCTKDDEKEARLRGRHGWEHLNEPIHVLITVRGDSEQACEERLSTIKSRLRDYLGTTDVGLKRSQLVQLAVIEGTLK